MSRPISNLYTQHLREMPGIDPRAVPPRQWPRHPNILLAWVFPGMEGSARLVYPTHECSTDVTRTPSGALALSLSGPVLHNQVLYEPAGYAQADTDPYYRSGMTARAEFTLEEAQITPLVGGGRLLRARQISTKGQFVIPGSSTITSLAPGKEPNDGYVQHVARISDNPEDITRAASWLAIGMGLQEEDITTFATQLLSHEP